MFDIAWSELLLIGAVALIFIGPKDLPKTLRSVGEMVGKVRRMAGEFQSQFQEAMRESELQDLKKQVEEVGGSVKSATATDFNPIQAIRDEFKGSAGSKTPDSTTPDPATPDAAIAASSVPDFNIPPPDVPEPVAFEPPAPALEAPEEAAPAKPPRKRKPAAKKPAPVEQAPQEGGEP